MFTHSRKRHLLSIQCTITILSTTACGALKTSVIQAPTDYEKELSKKLPPNTDTSHTVECNDEKEKSIKSEIGDSEYNDACRKYPAVYINSNFQTAEKFCKNIMLSGQSRYKENLAWGIPLSIIGAAGTVAGTTWAATSEKDNVVPKVTLAASAAIITTVGLLFLGRASAAATASGQAGLAFVPELSEAKRWQICLTARAKWLGANADAVKLALPGAKDKDDNDNDNDSKDKDED